jgi:ATP-dependent Clp protease ATP-binding subunit ClpA
MYSIIIFTSNLGMHVQVEDEHGHVRLEMRHDEHDPAKLEEEVTEAIKRLFVEDLQRPELLNRIGEDNIVVFNFISEEVGDIIYRENVRSVLDRLSTSCSIEVVLSDRVTEKLRSFALKRLDMGGRGIGTAIETSLVNPLARRLFELDLDAVDRLVVTDASINPESGVWSLEVSHGH